MTEYGPLRTTKVDSYGTEWWMYLDHENLPYTTRSDHRTDCGDIVPMGTEVIATRRGSQLFLTLSDGRRIILPKETIIVGAKLDPSIPLCA